MAQDNAERDKDQSNLENSGPGTRRGKGTEPGNFERPTPHHSTSRNQGRAKSKDITPLLKGWDYEAGTINVRKIHGADGLPKLQLRLDLGVLQMELTGRPDGLRPQGCESWLDFYETQLKAYQSRNGTELGFELNSEQCQALREEASMYYHRYLSLFVLEDFSGVVRDTARNLRVLDLCGKYAIEEQDRLILEQYRPYITMMNTRAAASIHFGAKRYDEALLIVKDGLAKIKRFFVRFGQDSAYQHSNEVRVLRRFGREIKAKMPVDPRLKLQQQLDRAVKKENYEEAARLRDELKGLEQA